MRIYCGTPIRDKTGIKFFRNECCDDATLFYVVHSKAGKGRRSVVVQIAARCADHPIRAWRSWLVDKDTYQVAEIMEL